MTNDISESPAVALPAEAQEINAGAVVQRMEAASEMERSREAAAAFASMMPIGWRSILTAPKDGTHILACNAARSFGWADGKPLPPQQTVVHWWANPGEEGFYTSVNELAPERPFAATHWKQLDAPTDQPAVALPAADERLAGLAETILRERVKALEAIVAIGGEVQFDVLAVGRALIERVEEIKAWKLVAANVSLAIAGTDVSTPAAFQSAQSIAACELLATVADAKRYMNECAELRATLARPSVDLYAFAYGVAQQVHAACEREEGFGAGNSDWSVPLRRIAREAADAIDASRSTSSGTNE